MVILEKRSLSPVFTERLALLVVSTSAFFYVKLRIGTALLHQLLIGQAIEFSRTWDRFLQMLPRPGGLATYLEGYLFQYFVYPLAGALIIAALVAAVTGAMLSLLNVPRGSWRRLIAYAPAVALLAVVNQSEDPLPLAIPLLLTLLVANVCKRIHFTRPWLQWAAYAVLGAATFAACGWVALSAIAFCSFLLEFRARSRVFAGTCRAVGAVTAWLTATVILALSLWPLLGKLWRAVALDRDLVGAAATAVVCLAYIASVMTVSASVAATGTAGAPQAMLRPGDRGTRKRAMASLPVRLQRPVVQGTAQVLVVLLTTALVLNATFSAKRRLWAREEYAFRHKLWAEVLDAAAEIPVEAYNPMIQHDVNRALYHTGRLPHEMFAYRQTPYGLLLMAYMNQYYAGSFHTALFERIADTSYELGQLNDSEHCHHERLQMIGDHPDVLRALVKINLAKGQNAAAMVFLRYMSALDNDLEGQRWATRTLDRLDAGLPPEDDEEIQRLAACAPVDDHYDRRQTEHQAMLKLLKRNPHNRMGFEYLMASLMLSCNLKGFIENLDRISDFDYASLPRHYQEAVMIYYLATGGKFDLGPWQIDAETVNRVARFRALLKARTEQERKNHLNALQGSYFAYYYGLYVLPRLKR